MSEALVQKRCIRHAEREAAARCPACEKFYCRECVTEHDGRVLCQSCLTDLAGDAEESRSRRIPASLLVQAGVAVLLLWVLFVMLGDGLASIPDAFHEGDMNAYTVD